MSSSFYERNIWAFTLLLKNRSDLFSEQDRSDLNNFDKVLIKGLKQISDTIEKWVDSHPETEIEDVYTKYLEAITAGESGNRGGPGGLSAPPPPSEEELRRQLTNAIRQNTSPASQPKKPKPDEKSK